MAEQRDVTIPAVTAEAVFSARARSMIFDPERPGVDPDQLLSEIKRQGGGMVDPRALNHNCPFCQKTMSWDLFKAHLSPNAPGGGCLTRWFHTVDITNRRFTGATPVLEVERA